NFFFTIVSCGAGQNFSKGAIVELTQDARLFNMKANIDRNNTVTGSGSWNCTSTSQPCFFMNSVTTAQENNFNFGNNLVGVVYNSTVGAPQFRAGGVW